MGRGMRAHPFERRTVWTGVVLREDPGIGRFSTKARPASPAVLQPLEE
jgi:hypothetical protein